MIENDPSTSTPERCTVCDSQMDSPLVCGICRTLFDAPIDSMDYFDIFRLDHRYDLDEAELKRRFLAISRNMHPDAFSRNSETMQKLAMKLSAELNEAYDTLRDPVSRAEYLLLQIGGESGRADKSVPSDFLAEIMTLREEISEVKESSNADEVGRLSGVIAEKRNRTLGQIEELARRLPTDDAVVLRSLRVELNRMKYWNNLRDQLKTI